MMGWDEFSISGILAFASFELALCSGFLNFTCSSIVNDVFSHLSLYCRAGHAYVALGKVYFSNVMEKGKGLHEFAEEGRGTSLRFRKIMADIQALKEEIEGLGCVYCDWTFQVGLVDFPAMIDRGKVFLCWSSDEEAVTYFHAKDEGFSNRKKIPPFCLQPAFVTI